MVRVVLGIVAAIGASTLYSLGIALQALDAREAPHEEHLRLGLAWGLAERARGRAGARPRQRRALARRHGPLDPRLAAADRRADAGSTRGGSAGPRRRPAGADV